jgi:hypothetical protein
MKTPEEMAEEYADLCVSDAYYAPLKAGFLAGYKAAENHFRDATKLVEPQWISVKDRLPEINQQFIAFVENKEVCNCCRYQNRSSDNSPSFYASTKTGLLICGVESISHWMPLPEAPKEEG